MAIRAPDGANNIYKGILATKDKGLWDNDTWHQLGQLGDHNYNQLKTALNL